MNFKCVLLGCFFLTFQNVYADNSLGQSVQIYTHLDKIQGKPSWTLLLRNIHSGQVLPYVYDFKKKDNFWVAFSFTDVYQVTSSEMDFGPYGKIKNFCHLQSNILDKRSLFVSIRGILDTSQDGLICRYSSYPDVAFPVAENNANDTSSSATVSASAAPTKSSEKASSNKSPDAISTAQNLISKLF